MWHMTSDMGHGTHDMWHMTCETHGVLNIVSKCHVFSSNGLGVMMFWRLGGKGWLSQWINYKVVCRTAKATPGLLTRQGRHHW